MTTMEDKPAITGVNVSFPGTGKGELEITEGDLVLYKRKGFFSAHSVVRRIPLSTISGAYREDRKLRLEGSGESGEAFVEDISFDYQSELDRVHKLLKERLEEKARLAREEEEKRQREKEELERQQAERYANYVLENRSRLWNLSSQLFRLCAAIPAEEWDRVKHLSDGLQNEVEEFLKLNDLEESAGMPDFRELAEKEDLVELERAAVKLFEYVGDILNRGPLPETPSPVAGEKGPSWEDLKYFFLYATLVGEVGLLIALDEPGELFQTAAKLEQLSPIMAEKFGFSRDKSPAAALRLPQKHEEATAICKKLVAGLEASLPRVAEERK